MWDYGTRRRAAETQKRECLKAQSVGVVFVSVEQVLFWAEVVAALLIGLCVLQIGVTGLRALRAGQPGVRVAVAVTAAVIGLGIALGVSWLGSVTVFSALAPTGIPLVQLLAAQLAGALVASWIAAAAYAKWLAPSLIAWFSREGTPEHG